MKTRRFKSKVNEILSAEDLSSTEKAERCLLIQKKYDAFLEGFRGKDLISSDLMALKTGEILAVAVYGEDSVRPGYRRKRDGIRRSLRSA
jgi:hypothetical protein